MDFIDILADKYNICLNEQQQRAVLHRNGAALVLAGPGSGKTTVLTARTAYLCLEAGVQPYQILSVTYSRASARDMKERFNSLYGNLLDKPVCFSTIHSFANKVIMSYEKQQGHTFTRLTDSSSGETEQSILQKIYLQVNKIRISEDEMESLTQAIGLVKNKMLKGPEVLEDCEVPNFITIYNAYEEYKRQNLMIDFDDMLVYAYRILRKCPEVFNKYHNRYRHVQLDEGQDASKIQFAIINRLMNSDNPNLFVVADDDQSIYGFRGAEPSEILNLKTKYPDCKTYRLEKNYRSSSNIVKISSKFIKSNTLRYDKQHATDNKAVCDPIILHSQDEYSQVLYVIDKINEQRKSDPAATMAILYRNNLSSIPLVNLLDAGNIDFKMREAKPSFFHHWVTKDIKAILYFSLHQSDMPSLKLFYYKISRFLSKNLIVYADANQGGESLIDAMAEYPGLKDFRRKKLKDLKIEFITLSNMQAENAMQFIKNGFKYVDYIHKFCQITHVSSKYACEVFEIIVEISHTCDSVQKLLNRLDYFEHIFHDGRHDSKANLTLSTFHSSKGLEFDTVFMVDLTNDEIPGKDVAEKPAENKSVLEEERRLFYVAMTRARKNLYMLFPDIKGGVNTAASIFVDETARCMGGSQGKNISKQVGYVNKAVSFSDLCGHTIIHRNFGKGIVKSVDYDGVYVLVDVSFADKTRLIEWNISKQQNLILSVE